MNMQTFPGSSLAEIFPGLLEILNYWMIGAATIGIVATIYLLIGWMIAHSRGESALEKSDDLPFHIGFVCAISLPLSLVTTSGIPGLVVGSILGAILALATSLLRRRSSATPTGTTN